jgi:flagellar protein FlbD
MLQPRLYQSFVLFADMPCRVKEVSHPMIELTRLNGQPMVVNCDLIKYVESSPDTMLTLIHGEKIVVSEPCAEVIQRISNYRIKLLIQVFSQISAGSAGDIANMVAADAGVRTMAAEQALHAGELPEEVDDAMHQRRRRSEYRSEI